MSKLANKLEKWKDKFRELEPDFNNSDLQVEFDALRADLLLVLDDMIDLATTDSEEEETEEDEE